MINISCEGRLNKSYLQKRERQLKQSNTDLNFVFLTVSYEEKETSSRAFWVRTKVTHSRFYSPLTNGKNEGKNKAVLLLAAK